MNVPDYEYSECRNCEYISECPHPEVNLGGTPKEPECSKKKGQIKIEQKPDGTKRIKIQ